MVVKHSKSLENIYDMLDNLTVFFSSIEGGNSNQKVLSTVENQLMKIDQELKISTSYKRPKNESN